MSVLGRAQGAPITCPACGRVALNPAVDGTCAARADCIGVRDGGATLRANQERLAEEIATEISRANVARAARREVIARELADARLDAEFYRNRHFRGDR